MKEYLETLKAYIAGATSDTKRSELVAAWNTAVDSYNADTDVVAALQAYTTARTALATALKSCIKMEYVIKELNSDCMRADEMAIKDCECNYHDITHFDDADNMRLTKNGERTYDLLRRVFEPLIYEKQDDGGCPELEPANF